MQIRKFWVLTAVLLLFFVQIQAQQLADMLKTAGIDSLSELTINVERYEQAFEAFVKQPIDHENTEKGEFLQRIIIRHRGFDKPVVFVTEGYVAAYALWPKYDDELAKILDANLIVAEHRFFGKSVPEPLDWSQLNLSNATADLHTINQLLKEIYPEAWVSTGISKGGQTTIYYRYFYPEDVQASVPYVAPLNFGEKDKRVYRFLKKVADKECRNRLLALQKDLLERREIFFPMFADSVKARNLSFERVGGIEKAFEYNVLELGFAYWQWYPMPCEQLPEPGSKAEEVFNAFISAAGYDFFSDQSIEGFQPFFYQALNEMGFYSYDTKPFGDLLIHVKKPHFHHALPKGTHANYSPKLSKKVNRWLRRSGNEMIYVYGEYDAWSSTAVKPGKRTNAMKLVLPGGSHATRIRHFDEAQQQEVSDRLKQWIHHE